MFNYYGFYVMIAELDERTVVINTAYDLLHLSILTHVEYGFSVLVEVIITHAPVHINDFRGVRARYVKRTG